MTGRVFHTETKRLMRQAVVACLDDEKLKGIAEAQIKKAVSGDTRAFLALRETVDGPVRDSQSESETGKLVDAALLGAARELLERIPKKIEKVVSGEDEPIK